MTSKSDFRKYYKSVTDSISFAELALKSDKITELLLSSNILDKSECIFVYYSYGREVNTEKLINKLLELNKTVLIPKCNTDTETMIAVHYNTASETITNVYGIKETEISKEYTEKIDLAIVPAVAFDIYGNRLGRGKGYYDKFFELHEMCKVGLCYSENLSQKELPHSEHDVKMNYIISDREVLNI